MKPLTEKEIREIIKDEMQKNYMSGSPDIPPHSHNGTDGLNVSPIDLVGFSAIPSSTQKFQNPLGKGMVTSVSISSAGSGYVVGDIVAIGGSIFNATAVVSSIGGGGVVTGVGVGRGGNGYSTATAVSTTGGTGTGLTLNTVVTGYEYGFGSTLNLYPASITVGPVSHGPQFVNDITTSQYPVPVVVGNGRNSSQPQGEFQGGYSPDGTLVAFSNGVTVDLYLRFDGRWFGTNMSDII